MNNPAPPPQVEASSLSKEEWFALMAIQGLRPDATLADAHEFLTAAARLPKARQIQLVRDGVEGLIGRGLLEYERDANGQPVEVENEGQKVKVVRGVPGARVISRAREFKAQ